MKVFLAATQSRLYLVKKYRPPYVLETFYTINDESMEEYKKCKMFLLDSGAFTFMSGTKEAVDWDRDVEKYAEFINKHGIQYFFELDIDVLVGLKEVERLRHKLETLTGRKCIPVWHKSRGIEYWKQMCNEYDFVAIGGIVTREIKQKEYKNFKPLIAIARKHNCKVHGLGFTATSLLKEYKFYSIDSTSWLKASRFGRIDYFDGQKMKTYPKPKNSRTIDYRKCDEFIFPEWVKFQKYAERCL